MAQYVIPRISSYYVSELPENSSSPRDAAKVVNNDLILDSVPSLNLAGFATIYMEPEGEQLMLKNLVR